jgi:hypothetical protein
MINAIRQTGATNILAIGGLQWANDLSGWLANKPKDPLNNIAATWHVYDFNGCKTPACWDGAPAAVAAQVPIIATEFGESDCQAGFINTLMTWLDQHSQSYIAWTWNTWPCSRGQFGGGSLIKDFNGTGTPTGEGFKAHLLSLGGPSISSGPASLTPTPTLPYVSPTYFCAGGINCIATPISTPMLSSQPTPTIPTTNLTQPEVTPSSTLQPQPSSSVVTTPSVVPSPGDQQNQNNNLVTLLLNFINSLMGFLLNLFGRTN